MTELSFPFKSLSLYLKERKYTAGIHQCSDSFWVLYGTRPFREQIKAMYKLMDMVATYQIKLYCLQKPGVGFYRVHIHETKKDGRPRRIDHGQQCLNRSPYLLIILQQPRYLKDHFCFNYAVRCFYAAVRRFPLK